MAVKPANISQGQSNCYRLLRDTEQPSDLADTQNPPGENPEQPSPGVVLI